MVTQNCTFMYRLVSNDKKKNIDIKISKFDQNKRYSVKKLYPIVNTAYGTVTRLHVNGNGVRRPICLFINLKS